MEVLQVSRDANSETFKAAYHRLAKERHPDHGGSDAMMAEQTAAYREATA